MFGSFGTPEIYNEVAGGINEGYADTFSAFLTKEWAPGGAARGPVTVEGEADRYRNAANELNYYHNLDNPYIGDKYQLIRSATAMSSEQSRARCFVKPQRMSMLMP